MIVLIKTHGSESRGQGGSSKQHPNGLETHTREYYTGTRVMKIENAITKFRFIPWSGAGILAQLIRTFVRANKIKFCFLFFRIPHGPLLENADIYTSTLILCNSLNYNLIDIKLGTILHLSLFYHSAELYGQNCWYQYFTALS